MDKFHVVFQSEHIAFHFGSCVRLIGTAVVENALFPSPRRGTVTPLFHCRLPQRFDLTLLPVCTDPHISIFEEVKLRHEVTGRP